jgi:hypothetical protein
MVILPPDKLIKLDHSALIGLVAKVSLSTFEIQAVVKHSELN